MSEKKLASAADFRNSIQEEDCYEAPREVTLPKAGFVVMLRKPKPIAYTLLGAPLPGIPEPIAADADTAKKEQESGVEEKVQLAEALFKLWCGIFAHPKVSLHPGPDEIHPDWVKEEDQRFVWRWSRGEVDNAGESPRTFRESR